MVCSLTDSDNTLFYVSPQQFFHFSTKRNVSLFSTFTCQHPAIYPEELIEPFVKATTEKNDLVLDVFAGSETTGVVALDLGRRFVGYEINGNFCRLCEQRLRSLNEVE